MLYAIGRSINKYHPFLHGKIRKYDGKKRRKQLGQKCGTKSPARVYCGPQNKEYKLGEIPVLYQSLDTIQESLLLKY